MFQDMKKLVKMDAMNIPPPPEVGATVDFATLRSIWFVVLACFNALSMEWTNHKLPRNVFCMDSSEKNKQYTSVKST